MSTVLDRLHRLSFSQLKALNLLSQSPNSIISSTASTDKIGKEGKALGGVFSSLARQKIEGKHLIIPWGRSENGKGLRWKLNEEVISKTELLHITKELLQ